jgi:hypothetical protein
MGPAVDRPLPCPVWLAVLPGSGKGTAESADRGIARSAVGGRGCQMLRPGLPARSVIHFAIWAPAGDDGEP